MLYNICGWLIYGEWKLADVVVIEKVGDNSFYLYLQTVWHKERRLYMEVFKWIIK